MQKSILIDINVILDVFLERPGFEASRDVLLAGERGEYVLSLSAHSVTTLAYLLESSKVPKSVVTKHIAWILQVFEIVSVDQQILQAALRSKVQDYEDAVVEQSAAICGAAAVITRNTSDFRLSMVPALTPEQFLQRI